MRYLHEHRSDEMVDVIVTWFPSKCFANFNTISRKLAKENCKKKMSVSIHSHYVNVRVPLNYGGGHSNMM